jgi:hypothetical protein
MVTPLKQVVPYLPHKQYDVTMTHQSYSQNIVFFLASLFPIGSLAFKMYSRLLHDFHLDTISFDVIHVVILSS